MTDNGACYKSYAFAEACADLGIKHIRTKPYTPQTNGKAERFVQSTIREWAYANEYQTSEERKADLPKWLHHYNWHRPHASLGKKPPISRLGLNRDNLLATSQLEPAQHNSATWEKYRAGYGGTGGPAEHQYAGR